MAINVVFWPLAAAVALNGWQSLGQGLNGIAHIRPKCWYRFLDLEWRLQVAVGAERDDLCCNAARK